MVHVPAHTDVVPTEVFADHIVLRPPNKLKERATRLVGPKDSIDATTVARAEHALDLLSQEFDAWMDLEIARLEQARQALSENPGAETLAELYRSAHDLRGQAATFGFPLAGEIADGLCTLIERLGDRQPPRVIVDCHVESIRAIVRENAKSRNHPLGAALAARLSEMRDQIAPRIDGE